MIEGLGEGEASGLGITQGGISLWREPSAGSLSKSSPSFSELSLASSFPSPVSLGPREIHILRSEVLLAYRHTHKAANSPNTHQSPPSGWGGVVGAFLRVGWGCFTEWETMAGPAVTLWSPVLLRLAGWQVCLAQLLQVGPGRGPRFHLGTWGGVPQEAPGNKQAPPFLSAGIHGNIIERSVPRPAWISGFR